MDVSDVKEHMVELKADIHRLLEEFKARTGCVPEVNVNWMLVQQLGVPNDHFPDVKIQVII